MAATAVHSGLPRAAVTFQNPAVSSEGVETDPNNRYLRYPLLLGRGACKRVYKAFDQVEGIEVAWNQVELAGTDLDEETRERLFAEIRVLKTLKHRNIMRFHDWWFDNKTMTINFITEYFTSGNLRQYRKKHKHISEQAIKRWAFQILEGLMYLHAHYPPIVHRDLKCDNILVNGTSGQVKIADLGLASCHRGLSVVGTPEFMAPEIYDEVYDEKVDIYSFGMCMLELATLEYPYGECRSIPAIFRKVSQGIPPAALAKVQSEPLREFITTCINMDPKKRPGALQLLRHEFFDSLKPDGPDSDVAKHGDLNIPFGSCGNLQSLGTSGSHAKSSFGRSSRPKTLSCAECTAASRAAKQVADEEADAQAAQSKAAATAGSAAAEQRPEQCPTCGLPIDSAYAASASSAQSRSAQAQISSGKAAGTVPLADSIFARGKSVCLALLNRTEPEAYGDNCEEDSDDEVIVALEDVLTPHPEDLMDPDTSHLHTLTHAGSGCTIVSGPDCDLESALSGLSMTGLLDQPSATGSFSVSSHSITQGSTALAAKSAGLAATGSHGRSSVGSRPASAAEASPAVPSAAAARSEQETSNDSRRQSSTAARAVSPRGLRQKSATADTPDSGSSRVANQPGDRLSSQISDVSPLTAALNSRSPSSSVPGGSPWSSASPIRSLHRSASTLTLQPSRGQLAAAGLLQMSPGVFVSTPPLLGKLLSKNGRQMGRRTVAGHAGHKRSSGSEIPGMWGPEQSSFTTASRVSSQPNLVSRDIRTCSCSAAVLSAMASDQSIGQGPSTQHVFDGSSQGLTSHQAHNSNGNQQDSTQDLRQPAQQQMTSRDPLDTQAGEAVHIEGIRGSITPDSAAPAAAAAPGYVSMPFPYGDALSPRLVNELNAAPASSSTAGAMFGKIVVRRKFARNLQKQAALKRSRSY